jgi:hypothetical protein
LFDHTLGCLTMSGCYSKDSRNIQEVKPEGSSAGPAKVITPFPQPLGGANRGKEVFRFATFGNEGFWQNAMQCQQGVIESNLTPTQMLEIGLQFDVEAMPASHRIGLWAHLLTEKTWIERERHRAFPADLLEVWVERIQNIIPFVLDHD